MQYMVAPRQVVKGSDSFFSGLAMREVGCWAGLGAAVVFLVGEFVALAAGTGAGLTGGAACALLAGCVEGWAAC